MLKLGSGGFSHVYSPLIWTNTVLLRGPSNSKNKCYFGSLFNSLDLASACLWASK